MDFGPDRRSRGLSLILPACSDGPREWGGTLKTTADYCGPPGNDRFTNARWGFSEADTTTFGIKNF